MMAIFLLYIKIPPLLDFPIETLQNNVVTMPEFFSLLLLRLYIEGNTNELYVLIDIALLTTFLWQLYICFPDLINQDHNPCISLLAEIRHTQHRQ